MLEPKIIGVLNWLKKFQKCIKLAKKIPGVKNSVFKIMKKLFLYTKCCPQKRHFHILDLLGGRAVFDTGMAMAPAANMLTNDTSRAI